MPNTREWFIIILVILLILLFFGSLSYECGCSNGGSGLLGSSYDFFQAPYIIIFVELALIFLSITIVVLFYKNQEDKMAQKSSALPSKNTVNNLLSSSAAQSAGNGLYNSLYSQAAAFAAKNPQTFGALEQAGKFAAANPEALEALALL